MPFPMIHLRVGWNILNGMREIKCPADFLLGVLAPDAVHVRVPYHSDMKRMSHLCVGDEKWGLITNDQEWQDHVLGFLKENRDSEQGDFLLGYCVHILTDIQNNRKVWTPFRKVNQVVLDHGGGSLYHQESDKVDYGFYESFPHRKAIWELIERAQGQDVQAILTGAEVNAMKAYFLNERYRNRHLMDTTGNRYVMVEAMESFIREESLTIQELILV
jgi:hypothetical protein